MLRWSVRYWWSVEVMHWGELLWFLLYLGSWIDAESAMLSPHPRTTYHLTSSVQAEVEVEAL